MRLSPAALAVLCFAPLFAAAQPRAPQLLAGDNPAARKPLGLAAVGVRVVIVGSIAETTMTLTFRNDTPRVLEGELSFPLPENATVSGYGLDINGSLVDGVPVEKEKARVAYETESRRRIDPGLVEHEVGNNFHTRVYPIPANGTRTIKVQYVSDVLTTKTGTTYRLPLGWGEAVDRVTVHVETQGISGEAPRATLGTETPEGRKGLTFQVSNSTASAEETWEHVKLDGDLIVSLPPAEPRQAHVERRVKGATVQDLMHGRADMSRAEHYFVLQDTPPHLRAEPRADVKPSRIGVLWDASLSRMDSDKAREIAVLRGLVAAMGPTGIVDLVAFRDKPDAVISFPAADGAEALFRYLDQLTYDGGTNLGLLPIVRNFVGLPGNGLLKTVVPDYAYWLLFTDGLADLGPEMPASIEARVHAISNDARSNHPLLRRIAAQGGGSYFNLQRATDQDVTNTIGHEPLMLLGVDFQEGEIADVYPRGAQPANGRVTLSGRLLVPEAKVSLKYGVGGVVMARAEVTLKQDAATSTGLISRYWAQQKVSDLSSDGDGNKDALEVVGKEFGLVTPNTSLLVLETVDQYLQYAIVPPKASAAIYAGFMARIEQKKTQVAQSREERVQQVLALWNQRVAWWEKDYSYPKGLRVRNLPDGKRDGENAPRGNGVVDALVSTPDLSLVAAATAAPTTPSAPPAEPRGHVRAGRLGLPHSPESLSDSSVRSKESGESPEGPVVSMTIRAWDPDVPYLNAMREAGRDGAYAVYLKQRPAYVASPAFYLDCADYLLRDGQRDLGVRVLTNIAELKLENAQLLRTVAHRLNQIGDHDLAINVFEKILRLRPEEPQSYRDLALALSDRADASVLESAAGPMQGFGASRDYLMSLMMLETVVMRPWPRFEEIELTALMEWNRVWARMTGIKNVHDSYTSLDSRLTRNLDCDVRIVLTWDADLTDVDLWVTEPSGEKCFYGHNRTIIGGMVSRDFTQGYGPEEYCLRRAMPGEYVIQCNYYGSSQISLAGPTTVQATVITHFGRPDEKREGLTVRLSKQKDVVDLGKIVLK